MARAETRVYGGLCVLVYSGIEHGEGENVWVISRRFELESGYNAPTIRPCPGVPGGPVDVGVRGDVVLRQRQHHDFLRC